MPALISPNHLPRATGQFWETTEGSCRPRRLIGGYLGNYGGLPLPIEITRAVPPLPTGEGWGEGCIPSAICIGLNHIDSNAEPYFYIYSNELSRAVSWEYGTQECRRCGFQQPTRYQSRNRATLIGSRPWGRASLLHQARQVPAKNPGPSPDQPGKFAVS